MTCYNCASLGEKSANIRKLKKLFAVCSGANGVSKKLKPREASILVSHCFVKFTKYNKLKSGDY